MKKTIFVSFILAIIQAQSYDIGDVMTEIDQSQSFDVCYGDYNSTFKFADLNGVRYQKLNSNISTFSTNSTQNITILGENGGGKTLQVNVRK